MSRDISEFVPGAPGKVKMYVCGPTVYNHLHIGNFRGPVFFNLVRNWLELLGYQVTYVFNYTDVDDKIIHRAKEEGVLSTKISEKYIASFEEDFNRLGLREHDHRPKVTDFIKPIVDFIEDLVQKGVAYEVSGEVFYGVEGFPSYGNLSGKKLGDLIAGQRVEVDPKKRHPGDFVLWKPSKEGEPFWDSPWGRGRPGWHIECSTMIREILGETIDIHGGAIDLIFPHHENEIAQGEGRTGCPYCRYWMHHDFINMNSEKMSKSLGNIILAKDFMDRYHPEVLKYLMLSVHYRSLLSVDETRVLDALAALRRIYRSLAEAEAMIKDGGKGSSKGAVSSELAFLMERAEQKIHSALNNDFNTGEVMAALFQVVRGFNTWIKKKVHREEEAFATASGFISWMRKWGQLMALFNEPPGAFLKKIQEILLVMKKIDSSLVEELVVQREEARRQRDWGRADAIRARLTGMGIELIDGREDEKWKVIIN